MSKSQGKKPTSPPRRKKRRWLRVLLILCGLSIALGLALNGPIARWFIAHTIKEKLAERGLAGKLAVEGALHKGFTLRKGHFTGVGEIELLSFDEIGVSYWILDLPGKKIDALVIRKIVVVAKSSLEEPSEETEEASTPPDYRALGDALRKYRPLFLPVQIDISEIDLTLKGPQEDLPLRFTLGALKHTPGTSKITLEDLESNALGVEGLREQSLVLTWEDEQIMLSHAQIIPELAVQSLAIDFPIGGRLSIDAMVGALGTELQLFADDTGNVRINLKDQVLDLSKLASFPDLELAGTIDKLSVDFENLLQKPEAWSGTAIVEAQDLRWPQGKLAQVAADCALGEMLTLKANLSSDLNLEASAPRPRGDTLDLTEWMDGLVIDLNLKAPSLRTALHHILPAAGQPLPDLASLPEGALGLQGSVTLGGARGVSHSALRWRFSDIAYQDDSIPDLQGNATLEGDALGAVVELADPHPEEQLKLSTNFDLKSRIYSANLETTLPDPSWLLPLIPNDDPLWKPRGPIMATWNGNGSLADEPVHKGSLQLKKLTLTAPQESLTEITLEVAYDWPNLVDVTSISLRNGDLGLKGSTKWANNTLTISELGFHDESGPVTTLKGHAPLSLDALTAEKYLAQNDALNLKLEGTDLKLARIGKLLPLALPEGLGATLQYDLTLGGTPGAPTLDGQFTVSDVRVPDPKNLPLLATTLTFATKDQRLSATGSMTEPEGRIVLLDASFPLELKACLENPDHFQTLQITANAHLQEFALHRLQLLAPALADAEGHLNADLHLTGSVGEPVLTGGATIKIDRFPLPDTPYRDVRDSKVVLRLEDSKIVIDPTTEINCAGGKINLAGSIAIGKTEPEFAIRLQADHLLAWRDDNVILRNNAQLKLDGPFSAARITGEVQFVESLFYKDIEMIPIGVPTANVPKPRLPQIDQENAVKVSDDIPEAFGRWTLDLTIRTQDPILIRGGNFATGKVNAHARIGGTLAHPRPSGTVTIQDAWARLPLAGKLNLRQSVVTLRPHAPYDPELDLRGAATIDRYNIKLNIFGTANSPQYNLFSDPPLPESEILTLLATGTTTENLEALDKDAAAMKGAQLAINWLKDKFQKLGKKNLFHRALAGLDELELNVGENDPFSGRKLNSATMKVAKNWFLSAAVDATGDTRGVVIFSVRFR